MRKIFLFSLLLLPFIAFTQTITQYICIDQFGYRPSAVKIAVLRNPEIGFDANDSYSPGNSFAVVNAHNSQQVYTAAPVQWNNGTIDTSSGDIAWNFDFSNVTANGTYYILDIQNNLRSYSFDIADDVYNVALKHAMRSFFYQRAGFAKQSPYAETGWIDGASHIGLLQDKNCRIFSDYNNASTEKDLHGGWYDAGDYNKYTTWTGNYIIELLKACRETPTAWTDDYNIPESGNSIPDILDEVKWGMDYMLRLQNSNGSMISIVGVAHGSPPSSASGKSVYGNVNTSATLKAAATFAYGSTVFRWAGLSCYADTLLSAAEKAWTWAVANPTVVWTNTATEWTSVANSGGGDMETDDYGRLMFKLEAASYLYEVTSDNQYKTFFDNNYSQSHLLQWSYAYPFEHAHQETMLHYTTLNNSNSYIVSAIKNGYRSGMNAAINFGAFDSKKDPYMAYLESYTWGSNGIKCNEGLMFYELKKYNINSARNTDAMNASEHYIHYLHGVNPLQKVYLSNMNNLGAENSVSEFYHTWFAEGNTLWDKVGASTYGPPPGYLVGGANPSYNVAACCPNNCGGLQNNALCTSIDLSKVKNQPKQKSYMDFNNSWPVNSWEVTENSCGYQVAYVRLLSKFVQNNGSNAASTNTCSTAIYENKIYNIAIFPNPSENNFTLKKTGKFKALVFSGEGKLLEEIEGNNTIDFGSKLSAGCYYVKVNYEQSVHTIKIVKH